MSGRGQMVCVCVGGGGGGGVGGIWGITCDSLPFFNFIF